MIDKNTIIQVTNRSYGVVGYSVSDLGIKRSYQPNETKEVTFEEMLKLSYSTGGKKLIEKYLVMENDEAVKNILGNVEPEYFYTAEDVKKLLLEGDLDQLEDCLNFADTGVIDLVKKTATDLEINDVRKRELIRKKTGYDVNNAIAINHMVKEEFSQEEKPTRRKTSTVASTAAPSRKAETPKYKVVAKYD